LSSGIWQYYMLGGEAADSVLVVLDLLATLVQFGLYMAVEDAEYGAKHWEDFDADKMAVPITELRSQHRSGCEVLGSGPFEPRAASRSGLFDRVGGRRVQSSVKAHEASYPGYLSAIASEMMHRNRMKRK